MNFKLVQAGVGEGHPKKICSHCGKDLEESEATATCSQTEYLTLCEKCYSKAGNTVR